MRSFLHSEGWEAFQKEVGHQTFRHEGHLYIEQANPIANYVLGSRLELDDKATLPISKGSVFLRLEPSDNASFEHIKRLSSRPLTSTFSVQPRQTSIVPLQSSEDEQIATWSSKHRYNLRLARKKEVLIESFSDDASIQFKRFWSLLTATALRQHFRTHPKEYYQKMVEVLAPLGNLHLLFATYNSEDVATLLLITVNETATYLHGASSDTHKEVMAPFPLHMAAMQLAKAQGYTHYDLWGTDGTQDAEGYWRPKEGAASAGVTRFKLGFGGEIVQYPGTFDVVLDPIRYSGYKLLRQLRGGQRSFS